MIPNSSFLVQTISKKYDISDPENPVKYFYDDSILIPMSRKGYSLSYINVFKNDYKVNQWYSFFSEAETKSFYSIERGEYYYTYNASSSFYY